VYVDSPIVVTFACKAIDEPKTDEGRRSERRSPPGVPPCGCEANILTLSSISARVTQGQLRYPCFNLAYAPTAVAFTSDSFQAVDSVVCSFLDSKRWICVLRQDEASIPNLMQMEVLARIVLCPQFWYLSGLAYFAFRVRSLGSDCEGVVAESMYVP
jgi:hypothetical protein